MVKLGRLKTAIILIWLLNKIIQVKYFLYLIFVEAQTHPKSYLQWTRLLPLSYVPSFVCCFKVEIKFSHDKFVQSEVLTVTAFGGITLSSPAFLSACLPLFLPSSWDVLNFFLIF